MNTIKGLTLFLLIGSALALKNSPDCDLKKTVQKCLKSGLLFEQSGKKHLPKNLDELNHVCEELKKSETCTRDFITKCAETDREQRVFDHSLEGVVRVLKRVCRTNTKKREFLANQQCGNAVLKDGLQCVRNYKKLLFAANKLSDKNKILRVMCCKIREVGPCVGDAMRAKGPSVCTDKNIEYFKRVHETVKEEITSVICADFERDNCQNVEVPSIADSEVTGSIIIPLRQLMHKVLSS